MRKTLPLVVKGALIFVVAAVLLWVSIIGPILHKSDVIATPIPLVSGETLDLRTLRGHVVVLNFWAPDCPSCVEELPALENLYNKYQSRGLVIIGITIPTASVPKSLALAAMAKVTYPLAADRDGAISRAVGGVMVTPTQVIINKAGKVIDKYQGVITDPEPMGDILGALMHTKGK